MATIGGSQPGGGGTCVQGSIIYPGVRFYPTFSSTATSYSWTLTSAPSGSATVMNSGAGGSPYFDPDIAGNYAFQLVATGGADAGTYTCTVVCTARSQATPPIVPYMLSYEQQFFGLSSSTVISGNTGTSGIVSFVPFTLPAPMALGMVQIAHSMSFSTLGNSSGQQTATQSWGIYSRISTTGTALTQIMASSYTIGVTGNNSTYSINQPTSTGYTGYSTGSTTSAGSNISSQYTGGKLVQLPVNQTLSAGQYWLGLGNFHSTSSIIVGISNSYLGANQVATMATLAPIGSLSANFSSGTDVPRGVGGNWNLGLASFSSAGQTNLPSTVAMSALSQNVSLIPYMKFIGTTA